MRSIPTIALAIFLTGCAAGKGYIEPPASYAPNETRGARIAERVCAGCHAVGIVGDSRNPAAPPFREIRIRYNTISLERELTRIRQEGHFEMRPMDINPADVPEIAAYIESMKPWR
jgi:mono/diheme cytochrome c family protein